MRHALRILLITLALILIGLALTPRATPAQGSNPCDPDRSIPYWSHLRPEQPCAGDSVTLVFGSCRDCVDLLGYARPDSGPLRLDLRVRDVCPMTLVCRPDTLEIPLGRFAAGNFHLNYDVRAEVVSGDSGSCTLTRSDSVLFRVGCPAPPVPGELPFTDRIQIGPDPTCPICPPRICPREPIPFSIGGWFPNSCYHFRGLELVPSPRMGPRPEPPIVRIHVDQVNCGVCLAIMMPWSADAMLPGLMPGTYDLTVQMVVDSYCDSVSSGTTTFYTNQVFTVKDSCAVGPPPPPPPPVPLPFVSTVRIGPPPTCADCPPRICPSAPISLVVAGTTPSNCYQFRGLQLVPPRMYSPRQEPPIVRLVVAQNDCMDWPCDNLVRPWAAEASLPGLPPGTYDLRMEVAVVSWCDSNHVDSTYSATRSFTVKDSCLGTPPPSGPCFMTDWDHFGSSGRCDAFVGPGQPARVAMTLATPVPLAGLQGTLSFSPPGLRISQLVPMGSAAGMRIAWESRTDGADFVMFAEHGAPIVPVRCDSNARCVPPPVLGVVLEPVEGATVPPVTHLRVHSLLASDSLGNAVPECQIMTLVVVESRICSGPSCDFNQDGSQDVRDLVAMVHCVLGNGPCPDTLLARLDCNGDGRTNVDDVLCCARSILQGGERDTMPGRVDPNVTVAIGEPQWEASGLEVPIRVLAADRIGAARLALALPLDRYEVTGVQTGVGAGQWLELHEVVDGKLVLGLIGLGTGAPVEEPATLDLTLHLALKPGQSAGGDVGLADLQVSGPDGVTLEVSTTPGTVALPSPAALALSAARPNPFAQETRFALNLDRGADVDLAILDLSGRRVATLFRGALGAGPHEFAWRGVRSDGSTAANGIYFVQARVGGERLGRKVIYLRGN
jgi:hypothetical protein